MSKPLCCTSSVSSLYLHCLVTLDLQLHKDLPLAVFFIWDRNVQLSNLFIVCSVPLAAINISLSKPYPLKNPFFILQILMPCYYQGFPCSSTCMNFVDCIFKILIHLIVNYVYKKYELWIIQAY